MTAFAPGSNGRCDTVYIGLRCSYALRTQVLKLLELILDPLLFQFDGVLMRGDFAATRVPGGVSADEWL